MSINLRLDPEMHAEVERLAHDQDRSVANLIKRWIRLSIERERQDQGQPALQTDDAE